MKRVIVTASDRVSAPSSFKNKIVEYIKLHKDTDVYPPDFIRKELDFQWSSLYKDVMKSIERELDYFIDYCNSNGLDARQAMREDSVCDDIYDDLKEFLRALLYTGPLDGAFRPDPDLEYAVNPKDKFIPSANI